MSITQKDIFGDLNETLEGKQDKHQKIISRELQKLFEVNSAKELIEKFNKEMSREEKSLVQTAIQPDRPINTVEVLDVEQEVDIDKGKREIKYNMPAGTLVIKYGKRKEDGADLTVYVWKNEDGAIQHRVLAEKIDYDKVSKKTFKIVSPSDPTYIRDRHVNQSSPGASSPLPESDKREW
jgi:hypothetical protein